MSAYFCPAMLAITCAGKAIIATAAGKAKAPTQTARHPLAHAPRRDVDACHVVRTEL